MITSFFRYNGFTPLSILVFFAYVVVILVAIVSHELAHGYVAYWNGDPTAKINGRLSLNPFKHLTPIGTLMMLLVGFGFAKPVPIDSRNFRDTLFFGDRRDYAICIIQKWQYLGF